MTCMPRFGCLAMVAVPGSEAAADGDDEGLDLGVVGEEFQGGGPPQSRPRPPAPRTVADLPGRAFEHTVFVLDGQGAAFAQSVTVPVRQGTALTTSRGGRTYGSTRTRKDSGSFAPAL